MSWAVQSTCKRAAAVAVVAAAISQASLVAARPDVRAKLASTRSPSQRQADAPAQARRSIYLTFDADMTPGMRRLAEANPARTWYDPAILNFLHDDGVPATIFMAGLFAEAYPDLVRRIASDPLFTIGDHGYRHAAYAAPCYGLAVLRTDAEKIDDLAKAQAVLGRLAGRAPARFRFPGRCHTAHDDELVRNAGLEVDGAAFASGDAFNRDAASIVREVIRRARDGSTVVFHLGGPNAPVTLAALRDIVPALRAKGFEFRALPAPQVRTPISD